MPKSRSDKDGVRLRQEELLKIASFCIVFRAHNPELYLDNCTESD